MTQTADNSSILRPAPELVSIVVPVFNEGGNVAVLAAAVSDAMGQTPYELIFVDDGSRDDTFEQIESLIRRDGRVAGLALSRNFGHQYALSAGLRHARGQAVVMMDGDMQHPPALLPELIGKWRQGYNIVQTVRNDADHTPLLKRLSSRAFYRVFSALCGIRMEPGMADFRLLDRTVADELNRMNEGQLFLRGLLSWMGYRRALVPFDVAKRNSGRSKYSLRKMVRFAKAGIFAFSSVPLRVGIVIGLVMAGLSFLELGYVLVSYLRGETVAGWASIVAIMSLLFGVLFLVVGIQGEYIVRIYERVQHRPPFLIERHVGGKPADKRVPAEQNDQFSMLNHHRSLNAQPSILGEREPVDH